MTKSQKIAADVAALLRARNPLIWIVSREEARVERYLVSAAESVKAQTFTWDVAAGCCDINGQSIDGGENMKDPGEALAAIRAATRAEPAAKGLWIMRDLPVWLNGPANASTLRALRNLVRELPDAPLPSTQAVVVLSPSGEVPPELADHATVLQWPLPDREEIGEALDVTMASGTFEPLNGQREAAIDAAVGLTENEALACISKSLVSTRRVDPLIVATEKKRVIARERILEWYDPLPGGLDAVGGLDLLKAWLLARATAYSPAARAYGLPLPKGTLVAGVPGTGKSLTAKAVATAYGCPLIRMDMGALKSKYVGDSEANIRKARTIVEAIGRCVLWIDEIEKAMQGSTSGSSDGGTSADQLGYLLTWMQENTSGAFFIATANDVSALPPELLRKGRFDELFFVDLPNSQERGQIAIVALQSYKRVALSVFPSPVDLGRFVRATEGFTGSEIAALVPDAMFAAFADGQREITTDDLITAAERVVPLSRTAKAKIEALQKWGEANARRASSAEAAKTVEKRVRALDL